MPVTERCDENRSLLFCLNNYCLLLFSYKVMHSHCRKLGLDYKELFVRVCDLHTIIRKELTACIFHRASPPTICLRKWDHCPVLEAAVGGLYR